MKGVLGMKTLHMGEVKIVQTRYQIKTLEYDVVDPTLYYVALKQGKLDHLIFKNLKRSVRSDSRATKAKRYTLKARGISFPCKHLSKSHIQESFLSAVSSIRRQRREAREVEETTYFTGKFEVRRAGNLFIGSSKVDLEYVLGKSKRPAYSAPYVGIEFEFYTSYNRESIEQGLIGKKLAHLCTTVTDSSIRPPDNHRGLEIPFLTKSSDLHKDLKELGEFLHIIGAKVNESTGLHVHLDARGKNASRMFNNLVQCLPLLRKMVTPDRTENTRYCAPNTDTDPENYSSRYFEINPTSLGKHSTIEVRMHHGSTNVSVVYNWVRLLQLIAYHPETITNPISSLAELNQVMQVSSKLYEYISTRIMDLITKKLTPQTDHLTYEEVA